MRVFVRLFARARDLARMDRLELELPSGATIGMLRQALAQSRPELAGILERSALAVRDEFAQDSLSLPVDAEVALLPPVSGGQEARRP